MRFRRNRPRAQYASGAISLERSMLQVRPERNVLQVKFERHMIQRSDHEAIDCYFTASFSTVVGK